MNEEKKRCEEAMKANGKEEKEIENQIGDQLQSIQQCSVKLKQLNSSRKDDMAIFGPQMKNLVDTIRQNCSRFSQPPIGPLGCMIKLRDYIWTTAVEQVIKKNMLHSFLVDNHRDEAVLKEMINRIYKKGPPPRPDVVTSQFQNTVYDVQENRPHSEHPTVLEMLDVANPNVLNALIDQCSVESILLIFSREEASRVVQDRSTGATSAYTIEGDQVLHYAHYSNKWGKMGILRESVEAAIRDEEAQCAGRKAAVGELREELEGVRRRLDGERMSSQDAARKVKGKVAERRKVEAAIEELRNALEEEEPLEDIATYDAEISELEEAIHDLESQHGEIQERITKLEVEKMECMQKCEVVDAKAEKISYQVVCLKGEVNTALHRKHDAERRMKHYGAQMAEMQKNIDNMESILANKIQLANTATWVAQEVSTEIVTKRPCNDIRREIKKLKELVAVELPGQEEQEEIETKYIAAMERFKNTKRSIEKETVALKNLAESLALRQQNYSALRGRIVRGYTGSLEFNHDQRKLFIEVTMDHMEGQNTVTNTNLLSGGERSFATLCFIMSLWDAMEPPFRCLDEFDVFMDMMNRRVSMGALLEHAKTNEHRQFIFFTPQQMSSLGIRLDKSVKIQELSPPERSQN